MDTSENINIGSIQLRNYMIRAGILPKFSESRIRDCEYNFVEYDNEDNDLLYENVEEGEGEELSKGKATAAQGHAVELLFGAHVQKSLKRTITGDNTIQPEHMKKYRNIEGKTPEQVLKEKHDQLGKARTQKLSDACSVAADKVSKEFLERFKAKSPADYKKLMSKEHNAEVVWTSKKGDHEAYTGQNDKAHIGEADTMIGVKDKNGKLVHAEGHSIKYAKEAGDVKMGSPSASTAERVMGMPPGKLFKHHEDFDDNVEKSLERFEKEHDKDNGKGSFKKKYGDYSTAKRKKEIFRQLDEEGKKGDSKSAERAQELIEHQKKRDYEASRDIALHLSSMTNEQRNRSFINSLCPEHTYKVFHTIIHPDGSSVSADFNVEMAKYLKDKNGKDRKTRIEHNGKNRVSLIDDDEKSETYNKPLMFLEHGDRRGVDDAKVSIKAGIPAHMIKRLAK